MAPSLIFTILFILCLSRPQNQAHGQYNGYPIPLSPELYEYFRPNPITNSPCGPSECRPPLPIAANMLSSEKHGHGKGMSAGIPIGLIFGVLVLIGIYYVVIQRHANAKKARPQEDMEV